MSEITEKIAQAALDIKAIKLSPSEPFAWASGFRMPVYNDNRLLLSTAENRSLVADGFIALIKELGLKPEIISGTATAGICPATTLADKLGLPFGYVRASSKSHGLQNRLEGADVKGKDVLLIEDLFSTGGSSISAVEAIRESGGNVIYCLSIFSYGFSKASDAFQAAGCPAQSLLTMERLLEIAEKQDYVNQDGKSLLVSWQRSPFTWGEENGFPKVEAPS